MSRMRQRNGEAWLRRQLEGLEREKEEQDWERMKAAMDFLFDDFPPFPSSASMEDIRAWGHAAAEAVRTRWEVGERRAVMLASNVAGHLVTSYLRDELDEPDEEGR